MTWLDAFADADEDTIPSRLIRSRDPERAPCTATELGLGKRRDGPGPLVSVVVPTYEDSQYLPDALESVGAQTYENVEVLLVDSSGVPCVERLAEECDWIRYVAQEPRGVAAARNEGIAHTAGEYVALLDADDYWHPEKLERQVDALETGGNASFTCYYFVKFWNNDSPRVKLRGRTLDDPGAADVETVTRRLKPHTSTLMFRSSAVPARPFREWLNNFEDIVFAVELFRENPPKHISQPLSVRRLRDGSLSDRTEAVDKTDYRIEAYDYLARNYPELEPHATRMKAKEAFNLGWSLLEEGRRKAARRYFRRSLRSSPPNPKALALYVATLSPVNGETMSRTIQSAFDAVGRRNESG